ncbi:MAG TPA: glycosyltransferase family 2 protein [Candidatus Omnitrophota bacterium]|nr:glycosyltransferase family 2 protein [Candidatus Omnitrophota bacterium]HPS20517.1 glycosyltransferase family 2 protein [Candidatus Omnitrophota bacterium]
MDKNFSISFVMPMYNESDNIRSTVQKVKKIAGMLTADYEIVIVDDASTDSCGDIVKDMMRSDDTLKLYRLEKNTMFGGAFAEAFYRASKDVIVYMDSDMPVAEEDILKAVPLILNNDVVTGYSKVKKGDTAKRKFISIVYNLMVQGLFGLHVKDINSGFKIVRKDLVRDIRFISKSPFIDVEIFLHAKKKNAKVEQYPLIFQMRTGGKSYIARIPVVLATFRDMLKVRARA